MRYLKILLLLFFTPLLAEEVIQTSPMEVELVADTLEGKEQPPTTVEDPTKEPDALYKTTESYETAFIKTIVVLVGLLTLVILTVWMFRKINNGKLRGMNVLKSIKILEKRPLSPKSILYLIEVGGKQVLITESQLEVRKIATLDWLGDDKDL